MGRYQKGKTDLDFTEVRDSEWQWHQLGCMQVCTSLQTDNHTTTQFFAGRMRFLPPNQQRQSTEGTQRRRIMLETVCSSDSDAHKPAVNKQVDSDVVVDMFSASCVDSSRS